LSGTKLDLKVSKLDNHLTMRPLASRLRMTYPKVNEDGTTIL
jgi:hypothetical protein